MGESVAGETSAQRVPALALTVFGFVLFPSVMAAVQVVMLLPHLPDSRASIGWLVPIIMIPTVITGIVSGLTAALGAYIGRVMSTNATDGSGGWKVSAGAGLGGALGSVPFLFYVAWWYQNGPGPWILVLGYVAIFGAYAGFAALVIRRRRLSA
ncbi:hypothetical protein [Microbacterium sp.]|uniref:hypothetical protein n=1 Tax=Microbacterium sp. TaxID=51671 RepID=UPI00289686BE|nr:hypothetical protein [Microbacterium sp.]